MQGNTCVYVLTHKFEVDEKFIKCIPDGLQMGKGKTRDKYYLDIENPELRDVTNWRVVPHNSKPHKPNEKSDFFTHIRREKIIKNIVKNIWFNSFFYDERNG